MSGLIAISPVIVTRSPQPAPRTPSPRQLEGKRYRHSGIFAESIRESGRVEWK
jgi:hypothetical protein